MPIKISRKIQIQPKSQKPKIFYQLQVIISLIVFKTLTL